MSNYNNNLDTSITLDLSGTASNMASSGVYTSDTITLSPGYGAAPTNTIGAVLMNNAIGSATWSINNNITASANGLTQPYVVASQEGKLSLKGKDADIDINGISLVETLKGIQDRLNILRPNKELEEKWDDLKALGQKYRELEAELIEKQSMWDTLKKMPPPEIE